MMTELWLIRHGQTDWNVAGRYQGQADIPLNDTGLAQAAALAAQLNGKPFSAIYSSDLMRTQQTAAALAAHTGLPVRLDSRLREIHQGDWEGLYIKDVVAAYPEARSEFLSNPGAARAPGGESVLEVSNRMLAAANDIAAQNPHGRVLVVSHGLAIATLICEAEHMLLSSVYSLIPDNASPKIITWG